MTTSSDCIFCKIHLGAIPAPRIYEDDVAFAIKDIQPQAKDHFLVIPKDHIATLNDAVPESGLTRTELLGQLMEAAARVARQQGLAAGGYRTVINTNANAGQTVFHIHVHVLGGEPLKSGFGS